MRRMSGETGVVAPLVAIFALVVTTFASFAVNSGLLYDERRQLQNGADAAAYAVAFDCARAAGTPAPAPMCNHTHASTVSGPLYANSNARDGEAAVQQVEPPNLSPASGEVTVRTLSREGGQNAVTLLMGNILGQTQAPVRAAATARWGGAGAGTGLPLTIPLHRWQAATAWQRANWPALTNSQGLFPRNGPFPSSPAQASTFPLGGAPDYPPGSWGWLAHPLGVHPYCRVSLPVNTFAAGTGADFGCDHPDVQGSGENAKFIEYVENVTHPFPLFDSHNGGTGSNAAYRVYSWAAIRLTGYRFPGKDWGSLNCLSGGEKCIHGWLTTFPPQVGPIGGPNTGIQNVQLTR